MIKLLVFILFICILFSAGIINALAFLGALLILGPIMLLAFGALAYAAMRSNSKRKLVMFKWSTMAALLGIGKTPKPPEPKSRIERNAVGQYRAQVRRSGSWYTVNYKLVASPARDHDWWFHHMVCSTEQEAYERIARYYASMDVVGVVWQS